MTNKKLIIKKGKEYHLLPINEIVFFYIKNKLVFCVDAKGAKHLTEWSNLKAAHDQLDERSFFTRSRNFIFNIDFIKSFRPIGFGKISVELDLTPPVKLCISQNASVYFRTWIRKNACLPENENNGDNNDDAREKYLSKKEKFFQNMDH